MDQSATSYLGKLLSINNSHPVNPTSKLPTHYRITAKLPFTHSNSKKTLTSLNMPYRITFNSRRHEGVNECRRRISLKRPFFIQKLAWGWSSRFAPSRQILPFWLSKCGLTAQKIAKNSNFGYKFSPKGYINLSDFYNILPGGGSPRTAPSCQISPL